MIPWVAVLTAVCLLAQDGATAGMDRIEQCSTKCSQGLHCKTKPDSLFPPPCQAEPEGLNVSSVFHNISLSTVMSCEGKQKCSLHLRVKTVLQLHESVQGVSICTSTVGMIRNCQIYSFRRSSRKRLIGTQVEVENDCTLVSPNQQVQVTVKTVPSFCGVTWTSTYRAPECINEDLRRHVPECITGRLSYVDDREEKQLRVSVSEMLEDHDYHLRLCSKDFICYGTGASALIRKEEPMKSVTLSYSRPLPCLCIEGWSTVVDALRVQVCPFKNRFEELWSGISFDPLEETLSWELLCPVATVVSLCHNDGGGGCEDLPRASQDVTRGKVTFREVDPHPQLCMKFTIGSQSWTRCPFDDSRFQAWDVVLPGPDHVKLSSKVNATFSLSRCVRSAECLEADEHIVHVEKNQAVSLRFPEERCDSCFQVTRLNVQYAATVLFCFEPCNQQLTLTPWEGFWWFLFVPAGVCLSGVIIITLLLHFILTVRQIRKPKGTENEIGKDPPPLGSGVPPLQTPLGGEILLPDFPQCGNMERTNLISE